MDNWRNKCEAWFGNIGVAVYRHPVISISLVIFIVAALAVNLRHIRLDMSTESFLDQNSTAIQSYNQFRETFGRAELIIVAIEADDVFSPHVLDQIKSLHERLEVDIPYVAQVDSLLNARKIIGSEDELLVEELFEAWPEDAASLAELKNFALSNHLYLNRFINKETNITNIFVQLDAFYPDKIKDELVKVGQKEVIAALEHLQDVLAEQNLTNENGDSLAVSVAGSPVVTATLTTTMMKDIRVFVMLVVGVIAIVLFLLYRRIVGVVLPLVTVILSVLSTVSLMTIFDQPLQLPTAVLPSFLLAVGVGDSIHFLTLFFRHYDTHGNKEDAVRYTMGHSGLAMLMTSLTTAAGLGSFAGAEIVPVANLGIFTAAGVMLAFLYTIIILPALLAIIPLTQRRYMSSSISNSISGNSNDEQIMQDSHQVNVDNKPGKKTLFDYVIDGCCHMAITRPKATVLGSIFLLALSFVACSQLYFSHNPIKWFPEESDIRRSVTAVDGKMGGSVSVEVVLDTQVAEGVYSPEFLMGVERAIQKIKAYQNPHFDIGNIVSVTDIVKETHQALNGNDNAYYSIPNDRQLVAQELFLLEISGGEELFKLVDRRYQIARLTIVIPWIDTLYYKDFISDIETLIQEAMPPSLDVAVSSTGIVPLLGQTLQGVINTTVASYLIAFVVITIMMVLLLGSVKLGLISMIPNVLPIAMAMGLMYLMSVPLDMFTMLIGSIAIGLTVDDTVHFMHNFRRYVGINGDVAWAIRRTLHTTGRAMLTTSLVLSAGFLVLITSEMKNFFNFGVLTAFTIFLALIADFIIAPALMMLVGYSHKESDC